jgi:hypothetical protein
VRRIDLGRLNHLGIRRNVPRSAEVDNLLGFGDAADDRPGEGPSASGLIVEVHDTTNEVYTTGGWYHIGKVNASGTKVDWGPRRHLTCCFAMYPSVAITNEG